MALLLFGPLASAAYKETPSSLRPGKETGPEIALDKIQALRAEKAAKLLLPPSPKQFGSSSIVPRN